ncbi:hypothetical protein MASR2M8_10520 [Opitutaceae bacterium]
MHKPSTSEPTEAEIQKEAYLIWQASGCEPNRALDHWLAAKELLRHRHGRPSGPRPRKSAVVAPVSLHFPPSAEVRRPEDAASES